MKKKFLFCATVLALLLCSCENNIKPVENETVSVAIGLSLEGIEMYDEPMTKGFSAQPYYAVKVEEFNPNINNYESYAAGVFSDASAMTITLTKSKSYNFTVALLYDYIENGNSFGQEVDNKFYYDDPYPPREVHGGYSSPFNKGTTSAILGDSYYGFLQGYTPGETCKIDLKRITTALKVTVMGISSGKLKTLYPPYVTIDLSQTNEMDFEFTTISMVDIYGYTVKDAASYSFGLEYVDKDEKSITLCQGYETFKRGYRKVINLNIEEDQSPTSVGISLTKEDLTFKDEATKNINAKI